MYVLKEISEYGKSLDLTGADLQKFIHQQQAFHRDQRAADREKKKEDRIFFLKKQSLEIEKLKLEEKKGIEEIESKYRLTI